MPHTHAHDTHTHAHTHTHTHKHTHARTHRDQPHVARENMLRVRACVPVCLCACVCGVFARADIGSAKSISLLSFGSIAFKSTRKPDHGRRCVSAPQLRHLKPIHSHRLTPFHTSGFATLRRFGGSAIFVAVLLSRHTQSSRSLRIISFVHRMHSRGPEP